MPFSQKIKQEIFVLCARHCCVCRKSKGIKLEVHHIKPLKDGGEDTIENAIPLCFDCHADAGHYNPGHPKGSRFSPEELIKHKDNWFKLVREHKIQKPTDRFAEDNSKRLRYSLKMEKRVIKELFDHKHIEEERKKEIDYFYYNPSHMFISLKIIIRDVDNDIYPDNTDYESGEISAWFKVHVHNTYHNGIELWLNPGQTDKVIMDKNGYWEVLEDRYDPRVNDPQYKVLDSKMIAQIPYTSIIELKPDGDEYRQEPHVFCKFEYDGWPYKEIYYCSFGNPEKKIPDRAFDKNKKTTFEPYKL